MGVPVRTRPLALTGQCHHPFGHLFKGVSTARGAMIYLTMCGQRAACRSLCLSKFFFLTLILCPARRPKPLCVESHPAKRRLRTTRHRTLSPTLEPA